MSAFVLVIQGQRCGIFSLQVQKIKTFMYNFNNSVARRKKLWQSLPESNEKSGQHQPSALGASHS